MVLLITCLYFTFLFVFISYSPRTAIYTLSLHDALPILPFLISCLIWLDLVASLPLIKERILVIILSFISGRLATKDRKSGSAGMPRPISYAVFCLKKKK